MGQNCADIDDINTARNKQVKSFAIFDSCTQLLIAIENVLN
jgi:hypothetical protein